MAYKIFFDVNVLLDYTLQRKNFEEIELLINNIENGFQKEKRRVSIVSGEIK